MSFELLDHALYLKMIHGSINGPLRVKDKDFMLNLVLLLKVKLELLIGQLMELKEMRVN
jgi:hypothetical protein